MANEQNLRPVTSTEEAKERGHNGGIKSGEVRRRKRTLRELADIIGDKRIVLLNPDGQPEDVTYDEAIIRRQYQKSIMDGDTRSAEFIAKLKGEWKDTTQLELPAVSINVRSEEQAAAIRSILDREQ